MKFAVITFAIVLCAVIGSDAAANPLFGVENGGGESSVQNVEQKRASVNRQDLESILADYTKDKDARIGVALIVNHRDTVMFNGQRDFPMMSVFKFPLSLAVAQWVDSHGGSLNDTVSIESALMRPDTYSPMFEKYGPKPLNLPLAELIRWSLVHSDNNACDILLDHIGGTSAADSILRQLGVDENIMIGATEAQMDADHYLIYLNRSTPLAMAALFDRFDCDMRHKSASFQMIGEMLEQCKTGMDRLPAPLDSRAVIGHKTGTGFTTPEGRLTALNDCGYIHLPDGSTYSIAVFVADSAYDLPTTSRIIAEISRLVLTAVQSGNILKR